MASKKRKFSASAGKLFRQLKSEARAKGRAERKAAFDATTLEQRRTLIAAMHEGKTLGEARELSGVPDVFTAMDILRRNTKTHKYDYILPGEEVK